MVVLTLSLIIAATASPAVAADDYFQCVFEDARISGAEIHTFVDGGAPVSVVLGNFKLTAGPHVISGDRAVVWIRDVKTIGATRHLITVYVEGDAKIVEPGRTATENTMLISMLQQGRLTAVGPKYAKPLTDFPLYTRGVAAAGKTTGRKITPVRHKANR